MINAAEENFNDYIIDYYKTTCFYRGKSIYSRFPVHYHLVNHKIRAVIMKLLNKIDSPDFDKLLNESNLFNKFDEQRKSDEQPRIFITIDVDSFAGYKKLDTLVDYIIKKQKKEFKLLIFLPAAGFDYSAEYIDNLINAGAEIGCHGFDHSGKLAFDNEKKMNEKFSIIAEFCRRFQINKFRAPAFILTENLYDKLKLYFKEDWSFRDAFIRKNIIQGCFYSGALNDNGFILRPLNTIPDCDYLKTNQKLETVLKMFELKIEYLLKNKFSPVLLFHSEPHFSGGRKNFEYFKKIIDYTAQICRI